MSENFRNKRIANVNLTDEVFMLLCFKFKYYFVVSYSFDIIYIMSRP